MTEKKSFLYWLAVEDGQTVRFSELPHLMAKAMHPGDDELIAYAAARINLEDDLKQAVRDGVLMVRNPAGMGRHTFPVGEALQRSVLIPSIDLQPLLDSRSIELRITPFGSGPAYWTIENAAAAMQEQEGWHDGTRRAFQDQMQGAAEHGELVVLEPRTCLPVAPKIARTNYELVTPALVNAWLDASPAPPPYRWDMAVPKAIKALAAPVLAASSTDGVKSGHAAPTKSAKQRRDSITPVIELAQTTCRDSADTAQVWPAMQVLAEDEAGPFLASTKDGLKYKVNGVTKYFTRDALDKRLHPEKRGAPGKRR